jgi:hypothetical protein
LERLFPVSIGLAKAPEPAKLCLRMPWLWQGVEAVDWACAIKADHAYKRDALWGRLHLRGPYRLPRRIGKARRIRCRAVMMSWLARCGPSVTIHIPLKDAGRPVGPGDHRTDASQPDSRHVSVQSASVTGLNPYAGEGGMIGMVKPRSLPSHQAALVRRFERR